jgi:hypothetical protein
LPTWWTPAKEQGIATDVPLNLMVHFSFTTLTTLGYGDVLPVNGYARAAEGYVAKDERSAYEGGPTRESERRVPTTAGLCRLL